MQALDVNAFLVGKDDAARAEIARRVGEQLSQDDPAIAERRAAEALARALASDAIELVRRELARSVRRSRHLPRDIALKIAHDVDSVACPFLEFTEVFSDSDWEQLVLTLSRSALIAVARRAALSERMALSLAEIGDLAVAETLVENSASPMTGAICHTLMGRFDSEIRVLDKLARREDLVQEIVVELIVKVSAAAREKLAVNYDLPDQTGMLATEAETGSLLQVIRETPVKQLPDLVASLKRQDKLGDHLLLSAVREDLVEFLAAALSLRSYMRHEQVRSILLRAGDDVVADLLNKSRVAASLHDDFQTALREARRKRG